MTPLEYELSRVQKTGNKYEDYNQYKGVLERFLPYQGVSADQMPQVIESLLGPEPIEEAGFVTKTGRSLSRGADILQQNTGAVFELGGEVTGLEGLKKYGGELYEEQARQLEKQRPAYSTQDPGFGDYIQMGVESTVGSAPIAMAPAVLFGALPAGLGAGIVAGTAAGIFSNAALESGTTYSALKRELNPDGSKKYTEDQVLEIANRIAMDNAVDPELLLWNVVQAISPAKIMPTAGRLTRLGVGVPQQAISGGLQEGRQYEVSESRIKDPRAAGPAPFGERFQTQEGQTSMIVGALSEAPFATIDAVFDQRTNPTDTPAPTNEQRDLKRRAAERVQKNIEKEQRQGLENYKSLLDLGVPNEVLAPVVENLKSSDTQVREAAYDELVRMREEKKKEIGPLKAAELPDGTVEIGKNAGKESVLEDFNGKRYVQDKTGFIPETNPKVKVSRFLTVEEQQTLQLEKEATRQQAAEVEQEVKAEDARFREQLALEREATRRQAREVGQEAKAVEAEGKTQLSLEREATKQQAAEEGRVAKVREQDAERVKQESLFNKNRETFIRRFNFASGPNNVLEVAFKQYRDNAKRYANRLALSGGRTGNDADTQLSIDILDELQRLEEQYKQFKKPSKEKAQAPEAATSSVEPKAAVSDTTPQPPLGGAETAAPEQVATEPEAEVPASAEVQEEAPAELQETTIQEQVVPETVTAPVEEPAPVETAPAKEPTETVAEPEPEPEVADVRTEEPPPPVVEQPITPQPAEAEAAAKAAPEALPAEEVTQVPEPTPQAVTEKPARGKRGEILNEINQAEKELAGIDKNDKATVNEYRSYIKSLNDELTALDQQKAPAAAPAQVEISDDIAQQIAQADPESIDLTADPEEIRRTLAPILARTGAPSSTKRIAEIENKYGRTDEDKKLIRKLAKAIANNELAGAETKGLKGEARTVKLFERLNSYNRAVTPKTENLIDGADLKSEFKLLIDSLGRRVKESKNTRSLRDYYEVSMAGADSNTIKELRLQVPTTGKKKNIVKFSRDQLEELGVISKENGKDVLSLPEPDVNAGLTVGKLDQNYQNSVKANIRKALDSNTVRARYLSYKADKVTRESLAAALRGAGIKDKFHEEAIKELGSIDGLKKQMSEADKAKILKQIEQEYQEKISGLKEVDEGTAPGSIEDDQFGLMSVAEQEEYEAELSGAAAQKSMQQADESVLSEGIEDDFEIRDMIRDYEEQLAEIPESNAEARREILSFIEDLKNQIGEPVDSKETITEAAQNYDSLEDYLKSGEQTISDRISDEVKEFGSATVFSSLLGKTYIFGKDKVYEVRTVFRKGVKKKIGVPLSKKKEESVRYILELGDMRFSLNKGVGTTVGSKLSVRELSSVVDAFKETFMGMSDLITVFKNEADAISKLADLARTAPADKAKKYLNTIGILKGKVGLGEAFIIDNQIFMLASNVTGNSREQAISRAVEVLFHESIGHYGLRKFLGHRFNSFINEVGSNKMNQAMIKKWLKSDSGSPYADMSYNVQVEEYIARNFAEFGARKVGFVERIAQALRNVFGLGKGTETAIKQALQLAAKDLRKGDIADIMEGLMTNPHESLFSFVSPEKAKRIGKIKDNSDQKALDIFFRRIEAGDTITDAEEAMRSQTMVGFGPGALYVENKLRESGETPTRENLTPYMEGDKAPLQLDVWINDNNADLDVEAIIQEFDAGNYSGFKLPDFFEHKRLYELYPSLKDTSVELVNKPLDRWGAGAAIPDQNKIIFNIKNPDPEFMLNTALHEVQHLIQHNEGWQGGSSPVYQAARMFANAVGLGNDYMAALDKRSIAVKNALSAIPQSVRAKIAASDNEIVVDLFFGAVTGETPIHATLLSALNKAVKDGNVGEEVFNSYRDASKEFSGRIDNEITDKISSIEDFGNEISKRNFASIGEIQARITEGYRFSPFPIEELGMQSAIVDVEPEFGEAFANFSFKPKERVDSIANRFKTSTANIARKVHAISDPYYKTTDEAKLIYNRQLGKGRVDMINEVVESLNKALNKADNPAVVYTYLTTREASSDMIADPEVRKAAEQTKVIFDKIGQKLIDLGMAEPEQIAKYKGMYLPRMYMKYLLSDEMNERMLRGDFKPGDMGYLKERLSEEKLPDYVRDLMLGEIKDPAYLATRGITTAARDIAALDFLNSIALNPNWAWQDGLIKLNVYEEIQNLGLGSPEMQKLADMYASSNRVEDWMVTSEYLRKEADHMRRYLAPQKEGVEQDAVRKLAERFDDLAKEVEDRLDINKIPSGYVKIPDVKKYGKLRGMYVLKEIHDDVIGSMGTVQMDRGGIGFVVDKLQGFNSFFKLSKTALNLPAGHIRNLMGSAQLAYFAGVPMHRIPTAFANAVSEWRNKGYYYRQAKKYGLFTSGFIPNEIKILDDEFKADALLRKAKEEKTDSVVNYLAYAKALLASKTNKGITAASKLYQAGDDVMRLVVFMEMQEQGKTEAEAAYEADKWIMDYSKVTQSVKYLRQAPLGAPFITYMAKVAPLMFEVLATKPWKLIPYFIGTYGMIEMAKNAFDWDDDDYEAALQSLPDYLREKSDPLPIFPPALVPLPYKDKEGRAQFVDISYLIPFGTFSADLSTGLNKGLKSLVDAEGGDPQGFIDVIKTLGIGLGPGANLISAAMTGVDPFTQQPVVDKDSFTGGEKLQDWSMYMLNLASPPFLHTDFGAVSRAYDAYSGENIDRYGNPTTNLSQSLGRLGGINVTPVDLKVSRERQIRRFNTEINKQKGLLKQEMRLALKKGYGPERRAEIRNKYNERIKTLSQKLRDYRTATSSNL